VPRTLPPLETFRFFEAAARHLSFTRAAEEMHVTHGAVSQRIKRWKSTWEHSFSGAEVEACC